MRRTQGGGALGTREGKVSRLAEGLMVGCDTKKGLEGWLQDFWPEQFGE